MRRRTVSLLPAVFLYLVFTPSSATSLEEVLQTGSWGVPIVLGAESGILTSPSGGTLQLPTPEGLIYSSLTIAGGTWLAAGSYREEDGSRRLLLLQASEDGGFRVLPSPHRRTHLIRQDPVLLVDGGALVGMAWLEGDTARALTVRAARWTGRRFRGVRQVAAAAPGSQLALTGTVLADGTWVLAWSAFDGEDDEILWTQRVGRRWLPPSSFGTDNSVPDITPKLEACGTGAVLAWSRYDGNDYRLLLARLHHGSWNEPSVLGAPGSLYPAFVSSPGEAPGLVFRVASTGGWSAYELDDSGAPSRQASVSPAPRQRPTVVTAGDGELSFRWAEAPRELRATWQPAAVDPGP